MNVIPKLITDNPELLLYIDGKSHTTVLGGIKLTGFDRLKVTLKIVCGSNTNKAFRHNLDLYNSIHTEQLIEKAGDALDVAAAELAGVISRLTTALEDYRTERLEAMKPKQAEKKQLTEAERKIALQYLKAPGLLGKTRQAISASGIVGEEVNSLIAYLIYTSRKRNTPLHLMCLGPSGTGKTWLQERVSELIPEEDKLEITMLSMNAFYYFGKDELKNKLLLIEDMDGADNVLYPLRELQSKRRISKTVTLKDSKEVRPVFRLSPSSLSRYLYELERMGYIKIARGSRYKGFEYKVQSWDDLETLTNDAHEMMENILAEIRKVNHSSPGVAQSTDGLHNVQKTSKKTAVAQQQ